MPARTGPLSKIEQMIYANAYSVYYDRLTDNPPPSITVSTGDAWRAWEADQACAAAEWAASVVLRFRDIGPHLRQGYGHNSEVYRFYRQARR